MDFLDPKRERRNQTRLVLGYCLIALAIGIATLVLLYQSFGYTIDREGDVTQSGLLFISSQPNGAQVYLNGVRYKADTNTRAVVPAGKYTIRLTEDGYRPWERPVYVAGGDLQRFDYPFLFPQNLRTAAVADLTADPTVATQSPDKRWVLLGQATVPGTFTEYDMKNPEKPVASQIVLPDGSFTAGSATQSWEVVQWAADSRHVLVEHVYGNNREYVLMDRDTPANSINLSSKLGVASTGEISLFNDRVDQFYVYNSADLTLRRVDSSGAEQSLLNHILAFKAYGDDKILYVTDQSPTGKATPGQVSAVLQDGQQAYSLRTLPPAGSGTYVLNLAQYAGDWYVAVASGNDSTVYVYKNPQDQTPSRIDGYLVPWRRLALQSPSFLSFSSNTQFLLAESGQSFIVYDLENVAQYRYTMAQPIDQPQTHATWMDGDRLTYVSDSKLVVFDYDSRNTQTLMAANATFPSFFSGDYSHLYTLRPVSADAKAAFVATPLVVQE